VSCPGSCAWTRLHLSGQCSGVGWQSGVALAHRHAVPLTLDVQTVLPCRTAPWPLCSSRALCGTWLWGSMQVRNHRFDPKADLYSLSFIFAEVGRVGGAGGGWARGRWVGGGCWAGCAGASSAQCCQLFHTSSSQQLSHPCATIHTFINTCMPDTPASLPLPARMPLQIWLVAEGAAMAPADIINLLGLYADR
jgi:hypothetical protein